MRMDFFTLFPRFFDSPLSSVIFQRARDKGLASFQVHDIRAYTHDKHHVTDDYPYGGGAGMVMKPEPVFEAVEAVLEGRLEGDDPLAVILLTPQGKLFSQAEAQRFAGHNRLLFICGHYEGVDERIRVNLVTDEISIGDYVLAGGELPSMVVADAVLRLVPGVLGSADSALEDSHAAGLLEYPHYTRPPEFRGLKVPDVLLSGHHGEVARWRRKESLRRTVERRPEMLKGAALSPDDKRLLNSIEAEKLAERGLWPP
jgi:tRNA (guanine37-N1)-methyltransferase